LIFYFHGIGMHSKSRLIKYFALLPILPVILLSACSDKTQADAGGAKPAQQQQLLEVSTAQAKSQNMNITSELAGRIEAKRVAQVRARVSGIVLKQVFKEGSEVKAGDTLFYIDPSQMHANLNSAKANLAKAQANLDSVSLKVKRYKSLVDSNAISQQEYEDMLANQKQAKAEVEAAKANQDSASLNLGYTKVVAPISGRIGKAQVTEGALVGQGEASLMATIQQITPIYVSFTQSSTEALKLQKLIKDGKLNALNSAHKVDLILADGSTYEEKGKLLFSDISVDETTGNVTLRAEFNNANKMLLPGMYVRVVIDQAVNQNAITIPQQAVIRTGQGASVMAVDNTGKVTAKSVKTSYSNGNYWIISEGLQAGEQVIVEGLQKVKPNMQVKTVPWVDIAKP
jgi:membrane fusion protein (multidrug efflux system)